MDELNKIIQNLVQEKTLSVEVFQQLQTIKLESEKLSSENKTLREDLIKKDELIQKMGQDINTLNATVADWKIREIELETRESNVKEVEHRIAISELKTENSNTTLKEIKEIVSLVFRNSVIRKNVMSNENLPIQYQSGGTGYQNFHSDKTETESVE